MTTFSSSLACVKPVFVLISSLVRFCEARLMSSIKSMFGILRFKNCVPIIPPFVDDFFFLVGYMAWLERLVVIFRSIIDGVYATSVLGFLILFRKPPMLCSLVYSFNIGSILLFPPLAFEWLFSRFSETSSVCVEDISCLFIRYLRGLFLLLTDDRFPSGDDSVSGWSPTKVPDPISSVFE